MQTQFSDEEIVQIRDLLDVAEIIREEAEYKAAVRLVMKTWKNIVIGLATVVGATIILREQLIKIWYWTVGG